MFSRSPLPPVDTEPPVRSCRLCSRPATSRRAGFCVACFARTQRARPLGTVCEACGVADRRVLRRAELAEGVATLCANHAAIAAEHMMTLRMLKNELYPEGERRKSERRSGLQRRQGERRQAPGASAGSNAVLSFLERRSGGDRRAGARRS